MLAMLFLLPEVYEEILVHCIRGLPAEACGLLSGNPATDTVQRCYLTHNAAASASLYTVDPLEYLHADRDAESRGEQIIGVFHSHTHTDAYPSPTDVEKAPDPSWHYVVVSLRDVYPSLRSYRIIQGAISEEEVVIDGRSMIGRIWS